VRAAVLSDLTNSLGWRWSEDTKQRLIGASSGLGSEWGYVFGRADEVESRGQLSTGDVEQCDWGARGRPTSCGGDELRYDAAGRRIEDARYHYVWTWRGRLKRVDVKGTGHEIDYDYDAGGRLLTRTELGAANGSERPFVSERAFVWEGGELTAEVGLNHAGEVIWRKLHVPGPEGADDQLQTQVEVLGAADSPRRFGYLRDEDGTVIAVVEEKAASGGRPALLARYFEDPSGAVHTEVGPELRKIEFDPGVHQVGGVDQADPVDGVSIGGALAVETTLALDPSTFGSGLVFEKWSVAAGSWESVPQGDVAIGHSDTDGARLLVMPIAGWPKGARYRVRLENGLKDAFGRALQLPPEELTGVEVPLDIPADGVTSPDYQRSFPFEFDTVLAASATLDGAFPGGQNLLFQGAWTDPATGLAYHRSRWYDDKTGFWLSEDPAGEIDSPNPYAYVAMAPHRYVDPDGEVIAVGAAVLVGTTIGLVEYFAITEAANEIDYQTNMDPRATIWKAGFKGAGKGVAVAGLAAAAGTGIGIGAEALLGAGYAATFIGGAAGGASGVFFQDFADIEILGHQREWSGWKSYAVASGIGGFGAVVAAEIGGGFQNEPEGVGLSQAKKLESYFDSDLSELALQTRFDQGIGRSGNVVAFEYEMEGVRTARAVHTVGRSGRHSEFLAVRDFLPEGAKITRLFTERQPCQLPIPNCDRMLSRLAPDAEVTYLVEYGDKASRASGNAALMKILKELGL